MEALEGIKENSLNVDEKILLHNDLGIIYLTTKGWEMAKAEFQKALALLEKNYEEMRKKGEKNFKFYYQKDGRKNAFEGRVMPHEELNKSIHYNIALLHLIEGNIKLAKQEFQRGKVKRKLIDDKWLTDEASRISGKIQFAVKNKVKYKKK